MISVGGISCQIQHLYKNQCQSKQQPCENNGTTPFCWIFVYITYIAPRNLHMGHAVGGSRVHSQCDFWKKIVSQIFNLWKAADRSFSLDVFNRSRVARGLLLSTDFRHVCYIFLFWMNRCPIFDAHGTNKILGVYSIGLISAYIFAGSLTIFPVSQLYDFQRATACFCYTADGENVDQRRSRFWQCHVMP